MELSRSDFLNSAALTVFKNEFNNKYFMKDIAIILPMEDVEITDTISELTSKVNEILDDLGCVKRCEDMTSIHLLQDNIRENYFGKLEVKVELFDLYDELIKDNVFTEDHKMLKIYRIEDNDGVGLYQHYSNAGNSLSDHFDLSTNSTPSPMENGILRTIFSHPERRYLAENLKFGFTSKKQLGDWLNSDESLGDFICINDNLNFVELDVPASDVISTNKQAVYTNGSERRANVTPFSKYFSGRREKHTYDNDIKNGVINKKESKIFLLNDDGDVQVVTEKKKAVNNRRSGGKNQLSLF